MPADTEWISTTTLPQGEKGSRQISGFLHLAKKPVLFRCVFQPAHDDLVQLGRDPEKRVEGGIGVRAGFQSGEGGLVNVGAVRFLRNGQRLPFATSRT